MIEIQKRMQRAAQSILDNEALSADLDDDAASVLLDWGVELAEKIAGQTIEMDDSQAEDAMYRPMRALRKMLRSANKWVNGPGGKSLSRVLREAPTVYGVSYTRPGEAEIDAFMSQVPSNALERVTALRNFLEGKPYQVTAEKEAEEEPAPEIVPSSVRHRKIDR